jgi:hypothetical protein
VWRYITLWLKAVAIIGVCRLVVAVFERFAMQFGYEVGEKRIRGMYWLCAVVLAWVSCGFGNSAGLRIWSEEGGDVNAEEGMVEIDAVGLMRWCVED